MTERTAVVGPVVGYHLEQPRGASEGTKVEAETRRARAGLGCTLLPSPGHGQQEQVLSREEDNFIWMLDDSVGVWECSNHILNLKCILLAEPVNTTTINLSTNH